MVVIVAITSVTRLPRRPEQEVGHVNAVDHAANGSAGPGLTPHEPHRSDSREGRTREGSHWGQDAVEVCRQMRSRARLLRPALTVHSTCASVTL